MEEQLSGSRADAADSPTGKMDRNVPPGGRHDDQLDGRICIKSRFLLKLSGKKGR